MTQQVSVEGEVKQRKRQELLEWAASFPTSGGKCWNDNYLGKLQLGTFSTSVEEV